MLLLKSLSLARDFLEFFGRIAPILEAFSKKKKNYNGEHFCGFFIIVAICPKNSKISVSGRGNFLILGGGERGGHSPNYFLNKSFYHVYQGYNIKYLKDNQSILVKKVGHL